MTNPDAAPPLPAPPPDVPKSMSAGELLLEFESLGDNCEFGLVQRYCGVEPLGLFRFSFARIDSLLRVLATRFADYGTDDDIDFFIEKSDQEFMRRSRRYDDFTSHTDHFASKTTEDKVRARELQKIGYLKDRMLNDLAGADKIFVRKRNDRERLEDVQDLARMLRRFGPNILVWVVVSGERRPHSTEILAEAANDPPPGHVEIIGEGLIKAYISRFAWYGNAHDVDIASWVTVCTRAYALARQMRGHAEPPPLIRANPVIAEGDDWQKAMTASLEPCGADHPAPFGDHAVTCARVTDDASGDVWLALKRVEALAGPSDPLTFSAWLLVPDSFKGVKVGVAFIGVPPYFVGWADLSRRGVWQKVWASTKGSKDGGAETIGLVHGNCMPGDTIYCTGWRVERGFIPN